MAQGITLRGVAVLPAQAGVVRPRAMVGRMFLRAPRAGGGGPTYFKPRPSAHLCSPRRRGWSVRAGLYGSIRGVLPAQAGVVRSHTTRPRRTRGAPRAGGGGPRLVMDEALYLSCSPRRRGGSGQISAHVAGDNVLPAQAGVVRAVTRARQGPTGAPRAGGGGPRRPGCRCRSGWCSPRRRGWSAGGALDVDVRPVLPAQAGVVRCRRCWPPLVTRAPRAGGGGPLAEQLGWRVIACSPRRRGWSDPRRDDGAAHCVLPAQAGVVQFADEWSGNSAECSPRRRGWSVARDHQPRRTQVLPAQAGVVRRAASRRRRSSSAPRAGGGGPLLGGGHRATPACSPRRRGWSDVQLSGQPEGAVLPAQAGVVRCATGPPSGFRGSPRAGGGGPPSVARGLAFALFSLHRRGWSGQSQACSNRGCVLPR